MTQISKHEETTPRASKMRYPTHDQSLEMAIGPDDDKPISQTKLGHSIFYKWAGFVIRFRWVFLALSVALTAFFGFYLFTGLSVDTNIEQYLDAESEPILLIEELRDSFGQDRLFLINVRGDVFTLDYLDRLKKLHDELAAIDIEIKSLGERRKLGDNSVDEPSVEKKERADTFSGFDDFGESDDGFDGGGSVVQEVVSLINYQKARWRNDRLDVRGLLDEWPSREDLSELKKDVLSDDKIVGVVVDKKGEHSVIALRTDFISEADIGLVYKEIERICESHRNRSFQITITGVPAVLHATNDLILSDQFRSTGLAIVVVLLAGFWMFRHPLGVLGPFLVVILADIWTLGLMGLLKVPISGSTSLVTAFVVCVGVGDAIHIQSVYRNVRGRGIPNKEAILHAISVTGIPVLFTSLTTVVGLLSLRFASLSGIVEMGTFSAFGVSAAFVNSLIILPIVLSFNRSSLLGLSKTNHTSHGIDRFLDFCNGLSKPKTADGQLDFKRRNILLYSSGLLVVFIIWGLSIIEVYHDALQWYPKDHPVYQNVMDFEKSIGGISNLTLLIDSKQGKDLRDKTTIDALEKLERHIENYRDPNSGLKLVHNTTSFLDIVRTSWRAIHNDDPAYERIPDTQRGVSDMLTLFENAAPDELKRFMTVDMKRAQMLARFKWLNTAEYQPLYAHIQQGIRELVGDKATVRVTGSVAVGVEILSSLIWDMLKSFLGAIFIITLVMLLLLKEIKLGLLAMIPNLLPVLSVMALMGFVSIPLDTITVSLGSIAIGIVVDDTIHFLHQFRIHYQESRNVEEAIQHAFNHSGRAMVVTSVLLVCCFMCDQIAVLLCFKTVGLLLSLIIVLALVMDLCLGPAILRLIYRTEVPDSSGSFDRDVPKPTRRVKTIPRQISMRVKRTPSLSR